MAREVKISLIVDEKGAVRAMRTTADESDRTGHKFDELDKHVKGLGKSFGGLKSMVGMGLGAVGFGGVAFGLSSLVSQTKEVAEETDKFSSITGLGAQSSLYYTQALKARGLAGESVGKAFGFLSKNMQLAERQQHTFGVAQEKASSKGKVVTSLLGVQANAFQELGINLQQFSKLSEQGKLEEVTQKFEGLKDGSTKTRLALQLFGRGGRELLPVLDKNNLSLNRQVELAKKYFPTLKSGAQGQQELLAKQAEMKMSWEGLEYTLGVGLTPTLTKVMGTLAEVSSEVSHGKGIWGELEKDIEGVWTAGKDVVGFLEKMGKTFNIPIGAGGLGATLMAFAGIHTVKHPIKTTSTLAKIAKNVIKGAKGDPLGDIGGAGLIGRGLPIAGRALFSTAGADVGAAAILGYSAYRFPGALQTARRNLSLKEAMGVAPGSAGEAQWLKEHAGPQGLTHLGGTPAKGAMTPSDATRLSRLLEHPNLINRQSTGGLSRADLEYLAGQFQKAHDPVPQPIVAQLNIDGVKVAEVLLHNPRAARMVAESTAHYAAKLQARR